MLIDPRCRAACSIVPQVRPAVTRSSAQISTMREYAVVSESGGRSRRPSASTGASWSSAVAAGWAWLIDASAVTTRHRAGWPGRPGSAR